VRYVKDRSGWTITATIATQTYAFSSRSDGVDAFLQSLEVLLKDLVAEAKDKGYTRRKIEEEIEAVRERLFKELYGDRA